MQIKIQGRPRYVFLLTLANAELLKMACELHYDGFVKGHGAKIVKNWIQAARNFERADGMVEIQVDDRDLQCLAKSLEMAWGSDEQQKTIRHMYRSMMASTRYYNVVLYNKWQDETNYGVHRDDE